MKQISILTGDVVNSRKSDNKIWLKALNTCLAENIGSKKNWEIFRGDSFQLETNPENAFIIGILLRLYMKQIPNIDLRISIGVGNKKNANKSIKESTGTAFENSGLAFESLKSNKKLLIFNSSNIEKDQEINIYLDLFTHIISSWTPTMCEIIYQSILHPTLTQQELSIKMNRNQSQISQVYKKTGYYELIKCLYHLNKKIANL